MTLDCSFESAFMKDYERQLNMTYASSDREWFIDILKRELEVEDGLIHKDKYKGTIIHLHVVVFRKKLSV